jgi:type IV pilus assembly protein PilF
MTGNGTSHAPLVIGLLAILLAGCVSTTESVFTADADPQQALEKRVELARQYIGEGNWENAKRNLKLAYDINPKDPEVHEAFALVYQSTGESELAEESYRTAISLDRGFSRARNNYAAFLFSQERYGEAEAQLEYVVADSLYNQRPRAFVNLGLCRLQLFDPDGAEQAFVRALSMDRTNAIALLETAHIRFDRGDYDVAGRYYDTYRTVQRQQSARGLWLGIRLARATGDKDAEASYALALRNLYPDSNEYQAYQRTAQGE